MLGTMTTPTTYRVSRGHTCATRSAGGRTTTTAPRNASRNHFRRSVKTGASTGLYDDETFAASVLGKYPQSHEPADTEEARVLWEHGYVALDVRASSEVDFEGKVPDPPRPGSSVGDRVLAVPLVHASRVYDSVAGKKVYKQEPFDADLFVNAVLERCGGGADIDANGAKLLVMDADGGTRAARAARLLNERGFTHVVTVKGGAAAWKAAWDNQMRRRQLPGSFSRGFDSAMFAECNVTAETFGGAGDDTAWVLD